MLLLAGLALLTSLRNATESFGARIRWIGWRAVARRCTCGIRTWSARRTRRPRRCAGVGGWRCLSGLCLSGLCLLPSGVFLLDTTLLFLMAPSRFLGDSFPSLHGFRAGEINVELHGFAIAGDLDHVCIGIDVRKEVPGLVDLVAHAEDLPFFILGGLGRSRRAVVASAPPLAGGLLPR